MIVSPLVDEDLKVVYYVDYFGTAFASWDLVKQAFQQCYDLYANRGVTTTRLIFSDEIAERIAYESYKSLNSPKAILPTTTFDKRERLGTFYLIARVPKIPEFADGFRIVEAPILREIENEKECTGS